MAWVVSAFADDPLLLTRLHIPLEGAVVVANHTLDWIVKSIANIVCSGGNQTWTFNVVDDEGLALRANTLQHLSVETTITLCAILPIFVLKWQIIIEEVVAGYKLPFIPFGDISTLKIAKVSKKLDQGRLFFYETVKWTNDAV